ncbi:hypothetical protein D3C73_1363360 [compost metagenome]
MSDFSVDSIRVQKAEGFTKEKPAYESQVLIRKLGGPWPTVPVRIHFTDGSTKDIAWSTEASEIQYKLVHSAPVDWVQIDPERTLVLESRIINNHLKAQVDDKQQLRFSLSLQKIIEALMIGVAW